MTQRMFGTLFRDLRSLAINNMEYFQNGTSSHHARFHQAFSILHEHLDRGIQPALEKLTPVLPKYDLSPDTQANGYRSLIKVIYKCCTHLLQLSRYINANRNSMFFRGSHYSKELDAYVTVLGQLRACIYFSNKLVDYCDEGSLFANEESLNNSEAEKLMHEVEMLSQECFYGRCLGFQFCESMQRPLTSVTVAMASFSEGYQESSEVMQLATSVINSGKYIVNPELRAQQVVNVTRTADVKFCKAFWSITESDFMLQMPSLVCPSVKVNTVLSLEPEFFDLPPAGTDETEMVTITPPCAHTGYGPVRCRLISFERREGQVCSKAKHSTSEPLPKSSSLLIHCHGGGFVAQSSRSHEVYTRQWAKDLNVPILSLDYSLSPEQPFPRALEECFYAYAWAIRNADKLGWTGETVCLAGDSAGGNLVISLALRAGSYGIKVPDGIVGIYPAVMIRYSPSPSRVLGLMDPLLPVGILARCLAAYAGVADKLPSVTSPPTSPDIDTFVVLETKQNKKVSPQTIDKGAKPKVKVNQKGMTLSTENNGNVSRDQNLGSRLQGNLVNKHDDMTLTSKCHSVDDLSTEDYEYQVIDKDDLASKDEDLTLTSKCHSVDDMSVDEFEYQLVDEQEWKTPQEEMEIPEFVTPPEEKETKDSDWMIGTEKLTTQKSEETNDSGINSDCEQNKTELQEDQKIDASNVTDQVHVPPSDAKCNPSDLTLDLNVSHTKPHCSERMCRSPSMPEITSELRSGFRGKFSPVLSSPAHIQYSPIAMFRHLPIVKNPYMSPLLAPDDMLKKLPPVHLIACHLDPLLDDAVMFAKRLRSLDMPVDLHLIDDMPHGFLNFSTVSKDAKFGSDVCVSKIRQVLEY